MKYSVLNIKETVGDFRIDAEAYLPKYLNTETILGKKKHTTLKKEVKVLSKGIFDIKAECYLEEEGIPFIRIGDLGDILLNDSYVRIPELENEKNKGTFLEKGDLVLSKTAYAAASLVSIDFCNVSQDIIAVKLKDNSLINSHYLATFLNCNYGLLQMQRWFSGNIQSHLNLNDTSTIKIPILDDSFQMLIEKYVERALELKRKSADLYFNAEQILLSELGLVNWKPKHQLCFVKAFSDTKSADRIDAEYFQPMYDELLEKVRHYKNGYKLLGDIVTIRKCIEPGSQAYEGKGIPFLRVSNLSKFGIVNDNQQYISEELYEKLKIYQPKRGEILLSKDATPGIAYYLNNEPEKMIPSGGILRLKVKDVKAIYPEYLTLVLNSVVVQKQIERDIGGSVINHWLVDQVKKTLIPILPEAVQREVSDKIADSFEKREQSKKLLDIAKCGVEMAIEKSEEEAEKWLNEEVNHAGSSIHLESR